MKSIKYSICLLLSAFLFIAGGCSEEETATKPYMIGTISTNMPSFIQMGDVVTVKAWGITYPEDITWKWYASCISEDTLVCNPVTLAVPDSLGEFGLMVAAHRDSFYVSSNTFLFQTIDTSGNETFYGPKRSETTFTDLRDRFTYDVVTLGNQQWFAQNLAWSGAGTSYKNSSILDRYFGRYYTWNEAVKACPEGWRLPSNEDWAKMASVASGKDVTFDDPDNWTGVGEKLSVQAWFLDEKMWEYWPGNEHTNNFGWNAIPAGCSMNKGEKFQNWGQYSFFWSATEASSDKAYYRYIYEQKGTMPFAATDKVDMAMNVRCVRDK